MTKRQKDERTNNDAQNTTQQTEDRVTRIPLRSKLNSEKVSFGKVSSCCSTSSTCRVTFVRNLVISHE